MDGFTACPAVPPRSAKRGYPQSSKLDSTQPSQPRGVAPFAGHPTERFHLQLSPGPCL